MSKRDQKPPVDFLDYMEKLKLRGRPITLGDQTFRTKPFAAFSDDDIKTLAAAEASKDIIAQAKVFLLGDYDEFVAAGGNAAALITFASDEMTDETVGEDGASSSS